MMGRVLVRVRLGLVMARVLVRARLGLVMGRVLARVRLGLVMGRMFVRGEVGFERSQNTVLLASTEEVYKTPHSTVRKQLNS